MKFFSTPLKTRRVRLETARPNATVDEVVTSFSLLKFQGRAPELKITLTGAKRKYHFEVSGNELQQLQQFLEDALLADIIYPPAKPWKPRTLTKREQREQLGTDCQNGKSTPPSAEAKRYSSKRVAGQKDSKPE